MFRISHYMQTLQYVTPLLPKRPIAAPVVIWNLLRRCNLSCKHCYSISTNTHFAGELSTAEIFAVMDDLKRFGVKVLILSGGEPLMHPDIFAISRHAKAMGFYVGLSTNGTRIDAENIETIADIGYNYVGISIDGMQATHDKFRRQDGAFVEALHGLRLCKQQDIKVGLRFTMTQDNAEELPDLLQLMADEDIDKFYFSHLNYAGRGNKNRKDDVMHQTTRHAMDLLFDTCWRYIQAGKTKEFVTGNNDADGIYLLHWVEKNFPNHAADIKTRLQQWGGNSSGVNIANIDNKGKVHPDTMWWNYTLGNVKQRPFSQIWMDTSDPLMAGLKSFPRPLQGRCGRCGQFDICGGNTRTRAYQLTGNFWAEDPGCYLSDEELNMA